MGPVTRAVLDDTVGNLILIYQVAGPGEACGRLGPGPPPDRTGAHVQAIQGTSNT